MKISPARLAAFDILGRIEKDGAFSSVLLPQFEEGLTEKDRALCHELTLGVLRHKLYLDVIIDTLAKGRRLDIEVRNAIRIGLFQLIFLDRIPAHAAIDESVDLALRARKRSAKGFVNAILRSFQREPFIPRSDDLIDDLCIATSHPKWLIKRWIGQLGFEETKALCIANNTRASSWFRYIDPQLGEVVPLPADGSIIASKYVDGAYTTSGTANLSGVYFQDEGSQLVAQAVIAEGGDLVLDVCASPGGKATMIAARSRTVVAGEIHRNRVLVLRNTCERVGTDNVHIIQYDARCSLPLAAKAFDVVFVDAPCSGTGTIRSNPEIRYSVSESSIIQLSVKQLKILQNASELVRAGGKLIYSTCSLEPDENESVCVNFLSATQGFSASDPKVDSHFLTESGFAKTWPHRDAMDGFFIAVFERN